jgi:nucleoside diphosphate kinase
MNIHPPYYKTEFCRSADSADCERFHELSELLFSDDMVKEVNSGNITFAMIRPAIGGNSNLLGLNDLDCANHVEELINKMGIVAKFSIELPESVVDDLYAEGPKLAMCNSPSNNGQGFNNRWKEFIAMMCTGKVTCLLLHSPDGRAIEEWRKQIGHWDISKQRDTETIRGSLATSNYNDLVHGSDSKESALREIGIIGSYLADISKP